MDVHRALPRAVIALATSLGVAGLGCGTPTEPSDGPANLTGVWDGSASDSSGPGRMSWQITQSGGSFSGTLTMLDEDNGINGRGSVSGSVSGASIQFSISIPVGGFDGSFAPCAADASGSGAASSSTITGSYAGGNSCTGAVTSGQLTLTKGR